MRIEGSGKGASGGGQTDYLGGKKSMMRRLVRPFVVVVGSGHMQREDDPTRKIRPGDVAWVPPGDAATPEGRA